MGAGIAVVVSVSAAYALVGSPGKEPAVGSPGKESAADPAHSVTGPIRTLVVSTSMPDSSKPGQILHGQLRSGPMPTRLLRAQVLTDEDCAPDASGISRCRNALRLEDGRTMVVRHPHDMGEVPCLTPGERVLVRPASL